MLTQIVCFQFWAKKQFFSLSYFLNIKFSDFISLECSFTTTQKQHNKNQLIAKWLRKLLRHCFDWGFLCLILIIRLWRTHLTCLDGNYNISLTFDHHNCPETHLNYTDIWCGKCGGTQLSWGKPYLCILLNKADISVYSSNFVRYMDKSYIKYHFDVMKC